MALLWFDGFDHYGADTARMTEGPYDQVDAAFTLSEVNPRTGARHLRRGLSAAENYLIFVTTSEKTTIGSGIAVFLDSIPNNDNAYSVMDFRDSAGSKQVSLWVNTDGSLTAKHGTVSGQVIGNSEAGVIVSESYAHVEMAAKAPSFLPGVTEVLTFIEDFSDGLDPYDVLDPSHFSLVDTEFGKGAKITNDEVDSDTENDAATREIPRVFYTKIEFKARVDSNPGSNKNDVGVIQILFQDAAIHDGLEVVLARQSSSDPDNKPVIATGVSSASIGSTSLTIGQFYQFTFTLNWDSGSMSFVIDEIGGSEFASGSLPFPKGAALDRLVLDIDTSLVPDLGGAATFTDFKFYSESSDEGADGILEVRVNGVTVISESSALTAGNGGESSLEFSQVAISAGGEGLPHGVTTDIDDFYIWDDSGAWNNSFLGDKRALLKAPDADTNVSDFDPITGDLGYLMIDESTPDDDITYIFSDSALLPGSPPLGSSEFQVEDLLNGISHIAGVSVFTRAKKTGASEVELFTSVISGVNSVLGSPHDLSETYGYHIDLYEYDPFTIANFTRDGFNLSLLSISAEFAAVTGSPVESPVPSFDPSDLFSLGQDGFWFDFSDTDTLWQDTSATTPVTTDGDPIARADGKAGNGYSATQGTAGERPTFNDSLGIRWSGFDGNDELTISGSTASLAWLHKDVGIGIAALVRFGNVSSPETTYVLLGNNGTSTGNVGIGLWYADSGAAEDSLRGNMTRGVGGTAVYSYNSGDNDITANVDHSVVINIPAGGPLDGRVDNVSVGTQAKGQTESVSNASFDLQIGSSGNDLFKLTGRIYQLIIRDEEFSVDELADIQAYFESKL